MPTPSPDHRGRGKTGWSRRRSPGSPGSHTSSTRSVASSIRMRRTRSSHSVRSNKASPFRPMSIYPKDSTGGPGPGGTAHLTHLALCASHTHNHPRPAPPRPAPPRRYLCGAGSCRVPSFAAEAKRENKGVPFGVVIRNPAPKFVSPAPGGNRTARCMHTLLE